MNIIMEDNQKDHRSLVNTLLRSSLLKVLEFLPNYLPSLQIMPGNIKDRLIHLMSKRGMITDDNVSQILHDKVRVLDFSDSDISDQGLHYVAQTCRQLRKLDLNAITKNDRINITSQGILAIAQRCPFVQVLYLRRCSSLTDEGLIAISRNCTHLQDLNIGGCPLVSDVLLQELAQNNKFLRSLNVSKSNVTDAGIVSLVSGCCANSLKELHIAGCQQLTDESVEAVMQFCPNIQVFIFHSCPLITDQSRVALEELMGANSKMKQVTWTVY